MANEETANKNGRPPAEIVVLPCTLLRPERTRRVLKDLSSERVFANQSTTKLVNSSRILILNLADAVLLDVLSEEEITTVKPAMRRCQNCRGNAVQVMLTRCLGFRQTARTQPTVPRQIRKNKIGGQSNCHLVGKLAKPASWRRRSATVIPWIKISLAKKLVC